MRDANEIGRRLTLHDLNVLLAVVESGSMGRAARRLHSCQPAISRSVASLERTLGVKLLERHGRGVEPTPCGHALVECGRAVLDDLRRGMLSIESLAAPGSGEIRVGANPFLAATFVAAVVDRLSRLHPRLVFRLTVAPAEALQRALVERELDLLVTREPVAGLDRRITFAPLFEDSFVVVVGARHRLARKRKLALERLAGEPWVLPPPESAIGAVARAAFRSAGLEGPHISVIAIPLEVRMSLLSSGRYVTIFPRSALSFWPERGAVRVLPVELPDTRVRTGIATLAQRAPGLAAQLFGAACREAATSSSKKRPA